jgi:hypothetical protein
MGLIADVKLEIAHLDLKSKALRNFGLLVGGVFVLLTGIGLWKHWPDACVWSFGMVGGSLMILGAVRPTLLRAVYRVWMTFSFSLGWCVSRILLTILFFGAIAPVALAGRLFGLPFASMRKFVKKDSYWVDHKPRAARHYEEMF